MPESSDAVTSGDEIDLDAQPMLNTQTSTATTTITAKDIIINRIWTKNVKRALVLLVPTFFVLYIWWQNYDAGLDYFCSRDELTQTLTVQLIDEHQANDGYANNIQTNGTEAMETATNDPADPLQLYLKNFRKAREELQARLDAIDWTPYEEAAAASAPMTKAMIRQYWQAVVPYFDSRPYAPITVTERPDPLPTPLDGKNHHFFQEGVLTGELRATPARVFDVFTMSYEVDVAEMRMFELDELVDKFVVMESSRTHRGTYKSLALARNAERYKRFGDKIIHLLSDEADLKAMIPDESPNSDHWEIDMAQRRIAVHKLHDLVGGFLESDIIITGDLDEIPYAEAINLFKYCEPVASKFPVSLGSEHTYRFNFNFILTRYHIDVPYIIPGSMANNLVAQGSDFRAHGVNLVTKLSPYSTHCTTFGDIMADVMKSASVSEARDTVPMNLVSYLSRPFEREADTVAIGIRSWQDRHSKNDRTDDSGWVGPVLCRQDFINQHGEGALPRIPWIALANPVSYHMYIGPMSDCPPL